MVRMAAPLKEITLLFQVLQCITALMKLDCGGPPSTLVCPNEQQQFRCEVSSVSMQWQSDIFSKDMKFFGSALGAERHEKAFSAVITEKSSHKTVSVLTFPSSKELDLALVKCKNHADGGYKTCTIHVNYPALPSPLVNLTSMQVSTSSVILHWEMDTVAAIGIVSYNVSLWTMQDYQQYNSFITNTTELMLLELQHSVQYFWLVEVENCVGQNRSFIETFKLVAKVPDPVENLKVCIYYNVTNNSYIANISWKESLIDSHFQSPILHYILYIDDGQKHIHVIGKTRCGEVVVLSHLLNNFTLSAVSEIGESIANPSIITASTSKSLTISIVLIGETYAVILLSVNFAGCTTPSLFNISVRYYPLFNETQERQLTTLYHTDANTEGRLLLLQNLHSNSTYVYSVFIYDDNRLTGKPQMGNFTTEVNRTLKDKQGLSAIQTEMTKYNHRTIHNDWSSTLEHERYIAESTNSYSTHISATIVAQHKDVHPPMYYSWVLIMLAVLTSFSIILLMLVCLVSFLLLKMRQNMKNLRLRSLNRNCTELAWCSRNALIMNDNDAYATVGSCLQNEQHKEEFRKRYMTE